MQFDFEYSSLAELFRAISAVPDGETEGTFRLIKRGDRVSFETRVKGEKAVPVVLAPNAYMDDDESEPPTIPQMILKHRAAMIGKPKLAFLAGIEDSGDLRILDLAELGNMFVCGEKGCGKSVYLISILFSILSRVKTDDVQLVMMVPGGSPRHDLTELPYLLRPVCMNPQDTQDTLLALCQEIDRRFALFEKARAENITDYERNHAPLPRIVAVLDEPQVLFEHDAENADIYLKMIVRAGPRCGVHLIAAAQDPTNAYMHESFRSRFCFKVKTAADSRIVIGRNGAEDLPPRGELLVLLPNDNEAEHLNVARVADNEIRSIIRVMAEAELLINN